MANRRHDEPDPSSSRNTIILLAIGCLAVAGLVVWALTRTVEPAPAAPMPAPVAATGTPQPATTPTATMPIPPPATTESIDGRAVVENAAAVPRISVEDLRAKLGRGEVTVIDVRDATSFATAHIPGALSIPFASVESMMSMLPRDKPIVTYCT